jgi:hypothetical protein
MGDSQLQETDDRNLIGKIILSGSINELPLIEVSAMSSPLARQPAFLDWLRAHSLEPAFTQTVWVVDNKYIIAFQFAKDEHGHKYVHRSGYKIGDAAMRDPVLVEMVEPLPNFVHGEVGPVTNNPVPKFMEE